MNWAEGLSLHIFLLQTVLIDVKHGFTPIKKKTTVLQMIGIFIDFHIPIGYKILNTENYGSI